MQASYRALLEQNRGLLLRGAEAAISGPSFNNLSMQLRHCCNHPFLIKGVVQAEGLEHADDVTWRERLVQSSGKLVPLYPCAYPYPCPYPCAYPYPYP